MLNELQAEANNILNHNNKNINKEKYLKTLSSHFDNEIKNNTSEFKKKIMNLKIIKIIVNNESLDNNSDVNSNSDSDSNSNSDDYYSKVMQKVKVVILVEVVNLHLHMIQIQQLLQLIRQKYLEK